MKTFAEPHMNHIDVKITYACNFKCEYCYQVDENGKRQKGVLSKEHAENLLKFIDKLGLKFTVTLAGGEPFAYPHLEFLVRGLSERGCEVILITNFSAPLERIIEVVRLCKGNMKGISISIHLSQWIDIQELYNKIEQFDEAMQRLCLQFLVRITCVVTDENFVKVKEMTRVIESRFSKMQLFLQRVYCNGRYHHYNSEIEEFLRTKGVDVQEERVDETNYYGRMCWAGNRFFYIESNGDVMRCYTRQENEDKYKLGNLDEYDRICILEGPAPCISRDEGKCICHPHFEFCGLILDDEATQKNIDEFRN